jgi:hypothetical protein
MIITMISMENFRALILLLEEKQVLEVMLQRASKEVPEYSR